MFESERKMENEIAEHERWLAGFDTPEASPELMDRVKQAIRHELQPPVAVSVSSRRGFWAAAAVVLLAVGVSWQSIRNYDLAADDRFYAELALGPASDILEGMETIEAFDEELTALEQAFDDSWAYDGSQLFNALEDLAPDRVEDLEDVGASIGEDGELPAQRSV